MAAKSYNMLMAELTAYQLELITNITKEAGVLNEFRNYSDISSKETPFYDTEKVEFFGVVGTRGLTDTEYSKIVEIQQAAGIINSTNINL